MTTRMLIDARHREETRVAVVKGTEIEEFDFESAEHKQLKGNVYLAKVTRVEPSLQAAFVDYGGNRQGFLAFSEIHPDYYQIPKADREALLREEAEAAAEEAALREQEEEAGDEPAPLIRSDASQEDAPELIEVDSDSDIETIASDDDEGDDVGRGSDSEEDEDYADNDAGNGGPEAADASGEDNGNGRRRGRHRRDRGRGRAQPKGSEEARAKRMALRRRYRIQDVIHRRQVLLVQVVKEERGNKGAALTTYLSLAGRYCVLMPNTSHGGGISRKISNASDRKRLKEIVADLSLPATMGVIVRTAGLSRTRPEIKRDFDYLARLWDTIRERTLSGSAPMLIHSDSDLVKRAIRDIYNRDIDEVIVEGDQGYRAAREFMKLLMPSHVKRVKQYDDPVPLFQRYRVEDQLSAMLQPVVQLKSGGYIVINPTEALVSIDINSGRSTKEHGIEATALKTNLEAAREIARQLRLRDMAGLIVIDFIDMEQSSNCRKVERAMKDALKEDRARIQVSRISSFGLMEMSRQRLRTGVLEASTRECPHCEGTGLVRTASSAALSALRTIEEEAAKGRGDHISLSASQEATIYVLNTKRIELAEIEDRYGVTVEVVPTGETEGAKMSVSSSGDRPNPRPRPTAETQEADDAEAEDELDREDEQDEAYEDESAADTAEMRRETRGESRDEDEAGERAERGEGDDRSRRKRRRRGRRGGRNRRDGGTEGQEEGSAGGEGEGGEPDVRTPEPELIATQPSEGAPAVDAPAEQDEAEKKPRRRSRRKPAGEAEAADRSDGQAAPVGESEPAGEQAPRSRRRRPRGEAASAEVEAQQQGIATQPSEAAPEAVPDTAGETAAEPGSDAPRPRRRSRAAAKPADAPAAEGNDRAGDTAAPIAAEPAAQPAAAAADSGPAEPANEDSDAAEPARKGWWQRTFG